MGFIKSMIEKHIPGVYVRSLMIGNNIVEVGALCSIQHLFISLII